MTIGVASHEQSHVTSHVYHLPFSENAEYFQGIDLYQFSVTDFGHRASFLFGESGSYTVDHLAFSLFASGRAMNSKDLPYRDTAAIAALTIGHKAQQSSKHDSQKRYAPLLVQ